jgi:hypothetical protein
VKVVQLSDPAAVARFSRELEITVRLGRQHPNIVTVHDTGVLDSGEPCLVMEYYDRGSLHDQLRQHGPLSVADVVAVGMVMSCQPHSARTEGVLGLEVERVGQFQTARVSAARAITTPACRNRVRFALTAPSYLFP